MKNRLSLELKKLIKILDKEKIWYSAESGTLLGAARDGKFIDWDDDIDLAISFEGYKKLKKKYPNNILDTDHEDYPLLIPKWIDDINKFDQKQFNIAIDLFIVVKTDMKKVKKFKSVKNQIWFSTQVLNKSKFNKFMFALKIASFFQKPLSIFFKEKMKIEDVYEKLKSDSEDSFHMIIINPAQPITKNIVFKEEVKDLVTIKFEGMDIKATRDHLKQLELKYGKNWKTPKIGKHEFRHINALSVIRYKVTKTLRNLSTDNEIKFTIIVPAYNSSSFINIPLDSLEKQTLKKENFEVLIIDDGSTDNLKSSINDYLERNKFWKYIRKENGNWGSVINYVKNKKLSAGKYITILDSDDYFLNNTLEKFSEIDGDILASNIYRTIKNKRKRLPVYLAFGENIAQKRAFTPLSMPHAKFYKKELFERMPDLVEGIAYQDTILYNWMASNATSIKHIKKPLAVWWADRVGNSTTVEWNEERAKTWINTCRRVLDIENAHPEVASWVIMYLYELNRHYRRSNVGKIRLNKKNVKFSWLPLGTRTITKKYFMARTKKYWTHKK